MMILYQINTRTIRYGELKRALGGIFSKKMLIQELNSLVECVLKMYTHRKLHGKFTILMAIFSRSQAHYLFEYF
ncbi:hypothetical protein J2W48_002995 [Flavobacterium piscis]|uniref:HTH hxlR-type domain-containing protein n=2 Tax=Flavobacterium piscis TaxID=1114874 RepID=A0ABU1YA13_9FLAO|nr:hypothetical protein [Flavobacterium piscis]